MMSYQDEFLSTLQSAQTTFKIPQMEDEERISSNSNTPNGMSNAQKRDSFWGPGFISSTIVVGISLAVLIGWTLDISLLKSAVPGFTTMKVNDAFGFLFLVASFYAFFRDKTPIEWKIVGTLCTAAVIGIAGFSLAEYLLSRSFGIDEILFLDPEGITARFPSGRIAPIAAVNFIFLALSFLVGNLPAKPWYRLSQFFVFLAFITSLQGLVGYALGITYLFGSAYYTQMPVYATIAFIFICTAIWASRPHKGFVEAFSSEAPSSKLARRMLLGIVFTPLLVRWAATVGYQNGYYDADFSTLIQLIGSMTVMGVILVWTASALHRTESERESAREHAEIASRAKTNFLANISHELRTPLGAVLGFSELLASEQNSDKQKGDLTAAIRRNGDQLLKLIDDLLDISKLESGHLAVDVSRFPLRDFLKDIIVLAQLKCQDRGVDFELVCKTKLPEFITSDSNRMRQLLLNVIGNAIKFNKPRGKVRLNLSFNPESATPLQFEIVDTGVGISEDSAASLFEPFVQGDETATRKFGGTGVGLALSRKIAEALGGTLELKFSELNVGSSFVIALNAADVANAPLIEISNLTKTSLAPLSAKAAGLSLHNQHILLVDDSADNRALISRFLKSAGAAVDCACDGLEGVDKALHGQFDIVLMDLQMPNLDGYDAIRRLRGIGYKLPIVALTAHALKEDRELCLELGFDEHLTKPVNKTELLSTVDAIIHAPAIQATAATQS